MKRHVLLFWLVILVPTCGLAQPVVWDPGEIARLAAQRAQIALALSFVADLQQQFGQIVGALGPLGVRPAPVMIQLHLPDFGKSPVLLPSLANDLPQRQRAANQAGVDGLALSAATYHDLASSDADRDALRNAISRSQDLRDDVRANSAIALAILAQVLSIKAMIALSVQQRALHSSVQ